nr:retrovirus-related Pol polyprotein from transposon TNT 1-94 [Tanacetum cinerariifolium]
TKDETSSILRKFITEIENLKDLKVKIIRSLIEAARTMLADAKLPATFWAEAVNSACYVQNRVLVNKVHNKTPYELFNGRTSAIGFLKPFGCHVMILNTLDNLGTKVDASKDVKKDVSSLRYIVLPNWGHEEHLESTSSQPQGTRNTDVSKSSGNLYPTTTSTNPPDDQLETLTVETPIPTASSPVLTVCFSDSQEPSDATRLISKRVTNQEEIPSLDKILTLTNQFEDILRDTSNLKESNRVEADSKEVGEQSFIATIHQKMDPALLQFCLFSCFLSQLEPKKVSDALQDPRVRPIGTKWVLKNKKDERGIVIRNKARLVAQGHTQEEGIDYDEVFAPVARFEAIRLFLAYASFMGFTVYQMDVKSAFLYGTIDEEVYMMQPPGFQDPEYPARVYKVEKAMYGLHQAPRAWYGTLSKYLLSNGFSRGTIDQTLYIIRQRGNFILVQVYMDDIIFGSSNPQLCREFEALMHEKFQMSAMGELNFFLGLQVLQKEDGIFLSQDKHYTRRARIAQSSALPPIADELASPVRDVSEGEACPTDSGFIVDQDRETIDKSSTLPHDTAPRVTSPAIVEGSMQLTINELTALCTSLQRQHSELLVQFKAQEVEINKLKERVKILEDNQGVIGARSVDDAPIRGRRIAEKEGITRRVSSDTKEIRMDEGEVVVERTSEDTEEMAIVLTSMDAVTVLAGGIDVPTGSYFLPTASPPAVDIHTGSDAVPTASPIIATATIVTPYSKRKGKEVMVESDTPKKQRLQEHFDAQVARELEEQQERKDKRMTEQIARDA